jgi:hypothetical protein
MVAYWYCETLSALCCAQDDPGWRRKPDAALTVQVKTRCMHHLQLKFVRMVLNFRIINPLLLKLIPKQFFSLSVNKTDAPNEVSSPVIINRRLTEKNHAIETEYDFTLITITQLRRVSLVLGTHFVITDKAKKGERNDWSHKGSDRPEHCH